MAGETSNDPDVTGPTPLRPARPLRSHVSAIAAVLLAIAIAWAAISFVPGLADRMGRAGPQAPQRAEDRTILLTFGAVIAGALLLARILRQPISFGRSAPLLTALALPAGAVGVSAALALGALGGAAVLVPAHSPPSLWSLLIGGLIVLWAAFAEELLFRGVVQPVLAGAWGARPAIAVTALAFTVPHYLGGWRDPISLFNIVLAGIWFGLLGLRSDGLAAPTLAHFGWNGAESLILGASPNPGLGPHGSIVDIDLVGTSLLGGSAEGLNASLASTLVLIGLAVATGWRRGGGRPNESMRAGR